jgi:hypothetical protein
MKKPFACCLLMCVVMTLVSTGLAADAHKNDAATPVATAPISTGLVSQAPAKHNQVNPQDSSPLIVDRDVMWFANPVSDDECKEEAHSCSMSPDNCCAGLHCSATTGGADYICVTN